MDVLHIKQLDELFQIPNLIEKDLNLKGLEPHWNNITVPSTQANTITPVPSTSNDPQLPQQVPKQQKVKKTLTDISRRFSKRILLKKQKDGNNQGQETVKGKQKKKDLEMQTISKPLTPVAQAVTDRLYNEDKISKGGPVKKSSTKATREGGRSKKNSSVKNSAV